MTLMIWAVIAVVLLVSILLIYLEHEWGFWLGGVTIIILLCSYFSAGFIIVLLPKAANSTYDIMAITAIALLALALSVIAYLAYRRSPSRKKP